MRIRPAQRRDLETVREVELAAGRLFAAIGLDDVAAHTPPPIEELLAYARAGRAWVAVDVDDRPVGFVLVDVVDGCAHVEQMSVHPDAGRRGIGRRLLDTVAEWAAARSVPALTLVTFREVPWNRPYYERLGFRVLDDAELGPELRAVADAEGDKGLDPSQRVCMRRALGGNTSGQGGPR